MSQELVYDNSLQSAKNLASGLYLTHAACLLFTLGALSIIPLLINYVKREDSAGTFVYSHHNWQIRSFWWYVVWMGAGWLLAVTLIGIPLAFVIWGVAWLWKAYRLIRGFLDLNNNKPMPG